MECQGRRFPSLDWPLSQEEKRGRLLQLYDKDVQAAEKLLREKEKAVSNEVHSTARSSSSIQGDLQASTSTDGQELAVGKWDFTWLLPKEKLWSKATKTALSLGLLLSDPDLETHDDDEADKAEPLAEPPPKLRTRSEGAKVLRSILVQKGGSHPGGSRVAVESRDRRVSFGTDAPAPRSPAPRSPSRGRRSRRLLRERLHGYS
ncbi:unnamed protein product [Cladocopium goreaui]|uniref:Uncharacterized protein n=1 Tax=Cladocopium goreaui TaxID=2562237 RepID=A0A9P1CY95_9DINO|nr:unnamed protein product [Cladocopium goreaui]